MFYAYDPTFLYVLSWEKEARMELFLREHDHYKTCTYEEACDMNPWVAAGVPTNPSFRILDTYIYNAIVYYPVWSRVFSETDKTPYFTNVDRVIEYEKNRRGI